MNSTVAENWSLNSGAGSTIQSSIPLNVSQNASVWVIVQNNYSFGGDYLVNIIVLPIVALIAVIEWKTKWFSTKLKKWRQQKC